MPTPITEQLLKDIGFVQQNQPSIWSLPKSDGKFDYGDNRFQIVKQNYGGPDYWVFQYSDAAPVHVTDLAAILRVIALVAYNKGVQETQNKLHDALGLHRLVDQIAERINDD